MRKVTCVFLLLSIVATLWSQTKVWTLKECMEYAVQNNTRVSSQEARNKIHTQNYREAVARLLPSVEADVSANFNFGRGLDSETNTYTDINSFGNTYGISSGVVLFDGLAGITRARIQKVNALLGKHQLQEAKDLTAYETMEAFFNSLYYREMVELARQQWQESSKNLQRTQRMEELGLKASPDVAELAAKEAADSYNLTRQKNLLQISIIRLKEKMYFPIEEELQIAGYDTLEMVAKTEDSPINIYQHALLFLPTAQVANASLRVGELSYRAAKGLLLPTLTAHGGISTGFARFMDGSEYIPFSEQFKNKRGYYVGFSLSLSIFDGLARVSNLKRSKQELVIARNQKEETRRTLYSDIEQAVADMNGQADEFYQADRQEEAMNMAHRLNLRKYEEGLINAIELHTSANRLMQARSEKLNARLKYSLKKRLVDYYRGEPFICE